MQALVRLEHVKGAVHATEHAEPKHVDLHELEAVDIVLVPFDDLAVLHRRWFDGNEVVETIMGQDETAWMLAHVTRYTDQLARKIECETQPAITDVEVELVDLLLADPFGGPPPDQACQRR
jgi:hypothetical protein